MNSKKIIHKTTFIIFILVIAIKAHSQVEYYGPFQHENNYRNSLTPKVYDAAINKKGNLLFTAGTSFDIIAWNLDTKEKLRYFQGASSGIDSIALSDDEKKIAGGSMDASLKIWDTESGNILAEWKGDNLFQFTHVKHITFSKEGNRIFAKLYPAYLTTNYGLYCWDANDASLIATIDAVTGRNTGKIISNNLGNIVFTDWTKLIDVDNQSIIIDFGLNAQPYNFERNIIVFSANNKKFTRSNYDVIEKKFTKINEVSYDFNYATFDLSKKGRYGIFGENKGNPSLNPKLIYDFQKGEVVYEFKELNLAPYKKVVFSDDTRFIIAVSEDNGAEVLDISILVSSVENGNKY